MARTSERLPPRRRPIKGSYFRFAMTRPVASWHLLTLLSCACVSRAEGRRIVATMERVSGLRFDSPPYADTSIVAVVFEAVSNLGYRRSDAPEGELPR